MSLYKATGVVLRARDFGEADKVVTVLTDERGKIEAVAKGARRPRSRLVAATQPFTHVALLCFRGRALDTLSQAEIRESFRGLREDLLKLAHAAYLVELVDQMVGDEEPHAGLLPLLLAALHMLDAAAAGDRAALEAVRRMFELRLLGGLGYRPNLEACAQCGGPVRDEDGGAHVSARLGGLVCEGCRAGAAASHVSRGTIETMRRLLQVDPRRAAGVRWDAQIGRELAAVLSEYIGCRVERRLRSADFLAELTDGGG